LNLADRESVAEEPQKLAIAIERDSGHFFKMSPPLDVVLPTAKQVLRDGQVRSLSQLLTLSTLVQLLPAVVVVRMTLESESVGAAATQLDTEVHEMDIT
jgi:hypothetical protein